MYTFKEGRRQERFVWLDLTRTVAIILVILNHAVELSYSMTLEGWNACSKIVNIMKIVSFSIGRLGVPLFLCLSGTLLLNKKFDNDEDVFRFYRHNFVALFITAEIWNVLYFVFRMFFLQNISWTDLIKSVIFFENNMPNMWYMPMILGVYLAVPFVAVIVQKFSLVALAIPFVVVLYSSIILPSINLYTNQSFSYLMDLSFLGGCYGCYILSGYYISKKFFEHIPAWIICCACVSAFSLSVGMQFISYERGIEYNVWYNFVGHYVSGILLFELLRRYGGGQLCKSAKKVVAYLSQISLGLFFIHMPMQMMFAKLVQGGIISVLLLWIGVVIAGSMILYFLEKNILIRKYVFHIR